jgi:hypothetical protein
LLDEDRHGCGAQRLRYAADPELRRRAGGQASLEVRVAKRFRPDDLAVHGDRHGEPRDLRELRAEECSGPGRGREVALRDRSAEL